MITAMTSRLAARVAAQSARPLQMLARRAALSVASARAAPVAFVPTIRQAVQIRHQSTSAAAPNSTTKTETKAANSAASARIDPSGNVSVIFPNGDVSAFHGIWLRDHCRCSQCFHEVTKQRLIDTSEIPLDIRPASVGITETGIVVNWSSPDHTSTFSFEWLRQHAYAPPLSGRVDIEQREIKYWGATLLNNLPTTPYKAIMERDDGLAAWLDNIDKYGIGFVSGVPTTPQDTEKLARRVSFIRESHYGGFWDFSPNLEHGDTAYTSIALPAHTDTTYFTDPVGLQFFHLLEHRGKGGESLYVDGFHVAEQLRTRVPWAFEALATIPITAHSAGDKHTLMQPTPAYFTVLNVSPHTGRVFQIRYNNDDRSVLRHLPPSDVKTFYAALKEWTKLLRESRNELWVALKPGLAVMVDNWRVLHGRAEFSGFRRMVGSYHGWDDYRSRVKMVCRRGSDKELI